MRRTLAGLGIAFALVIAPGTALAGSGNPNGTGQPSQSCEEQPSGPNGFNTGGFATAQGKYAPGSQYDVACYQVSRHA